MMINVNCDTNNTLNIQGMNWKEEKKQFLFHWLKNPHSKFKVLSKSKYEPDVVFSIQLYFLLEICIQ